MLALASLLSRLLVRPLFELLVRHGKRMLDSFLPWLHKPRFHFVNMPAIPAQQLCLFSCLRQASCVRVFSAVSVLVRNLKGRACVVSKSNSVSWKQEQEQEQEQEHYHLESPGKVHHRQLDSSWLTRATLPCKASSVSSRPIFSAGTMISLPTRLCKKLQAPAEVIATVVLPPTARQPPDA